jgi:hypothetical protein
MSFSKTTFGITTRSIPIKMQNTNNKNDNQHSEPLRTTQNHSESSHCSECCYAACRTCLWLYWVSLCWCRYAECLYADCRGAIYFGLQLTQPLYFFFFCKKKMIVSLSPFREAAGSADISANFRLGGACRSINLQNNALIRRIKWSLICLLANCGGTGVEHSPAHRDLKGSNPVGMENVICFWFYLLLQLCPMY